MRLEFGESHLDRIEIRTVGREEEEPGSALFDDLMRFLALVARQVVEDHDVAGIECRRELGLDIDLEDLSRHRPVDDPGGGQAVAAQAGNEGLCLPVAERCTSLEPLTVKRPATQPCQLRRGRRLIDEDQPVGLLTHARLTMQPPSAARFADIIAPALRRQQLFFYI